MVEKTRGLVRDLHYRAEHVREGLVINYETLSKCAEAVVSGEGSWSHATAASGHGVADSPGASPKPDGQGGWSAPPARPLAKLGSADRLSTEELAAEGTELPAPPMVSSSRQRTPEMQTFPAPPPGSKPPPLGN